MFYRLPPHLSVVEISDILSEAPHAVTHMYITHTDMRYCIWLLWETMKARV